MYKELYKYLVVNKKISFPGIGSFVIDDVSSSVDENACIIKPGQQIIRFLNSDENNFNHSLFSFLSKEYNETEIESENKFNRFIARAKNYLQKNVLVLPALGTLKKYGINEDIEFVPQQKNIKHLFPLIGLTPKLKVAEKKEEPIILQPDPIIQIPVAPEPQPMREIFIEEEEEETDATKKRRDSWWIYAIVLTLAAAAGLLYYYLYYINLIG